MISRETTSAEITIRPFHEDDRRSLIALWRASGLCTSNNNPDLDIDRKLKVDPQLLLVAIKDEELVGSLMGGYEGHRGWVNYLAVSSNYRRQGIASRLMNRIEVDLLAKGCPKVNMQVRNTNVEVLAFYAALGYLDDKVIGLGKRLVYDN